MQGNSAQDHADLRSWLSRLDAQGRLAVAEERQQQRLALDDQDRAGQREHDEASRAFDEPIGRRDGDPRTERQSAAPVDPLRRRVGALRRDLVPVVEPVGIRRFRGHDVEPEEPLRALERQARLTEAGGELLREGARLLGEIDAIANRVKRVATGWEPRLTIAVDSIILELE